MKQDKQWKERFDEEFVNQGDCDAFEFPEDARPRHIKSFISKELTKAKEELLIAEDLVTMEVFKKGCDAAQIDAVEKVIEFLEEGQNHPEAFWARALPIIADEIKSKFLTTKEDE